MKWLRTLFVFLIIICFSCGCKNSDVTGIAICEDESVLIDFYEDNGTAHIVCRIVLENNLSTDVTIKMIGISYEDVATGLLADPYLTGTNIEDQSTTFLIKANSRCEIIVDFCGEYAGNLQKADRLPPDVLEVEVVTINSNKSPCFLRLRAM